MTKNLTADDVVLGLAAAICERATELITDGWTKGKMRGGSGGVQSWCIHGAIEMAMEETFGRRDLGQAVQRDVEQVAVAFICDQAFGSLREATGGIPAARYNDASTRRHDEVIGVMSGATKRLWDVTFDTGSSGSRTFEYSRWADVDEAQATQYLHATLGTN